MRRAQIALEDAQGTRNLVSPYRPGRDEEQRRRLQLAAGLRTAIETDALRLVFQPELNLRAARSRSWRHWCAGSIRCWAICRLPNSCPSPSTPAAPGI